MLRNIQFYLILSSLIGVGLCEQAVFYDAANYQGGSLTLSVSGGCYNFKNQWGNGVASAQIQPGDCISAWDAIDCNGRSFRLLKQMPNTDELLKYAGFHQRMRSISLCSSSSSSSSSLEEDNEPLRPIANVDERNQISDRFLKPVTIESVTESVELNFYDEPNFEGNIFTLTTTGECYSFKSKWRNRISSLDAQASSWCVIAWDNLDCKGSSIRLENGKNNLNENLKLSNFDKKIKSIYSCSENDNEQEHDDSSSQVELSQLDIKSIALEEHNKYRLLHGVNPLKSSEKLENVAQNFADYLAHSDKLHHSSDLEYGENLAGISIPNKSKALKEAIKAWYNEINNYDFENPRYSVKGLKVGHFTALVWKTTTHVGVGIAWNPKRRWWIVVANYSPPGNLKGTYAENVFPPI
ncbi:unnamed protein product [Orchesella dallaii]|uniref:SCP domain-containing protein n=1 Tax=Orchesella dallaii TaxID=48710 RepID=A0ABP1R175_9HEXA